MEINKLDFTKGRQRPTDYISIFTTIADHYTNGIPHGVQKDGIQNVFHTASKNAQVVVNFELIENKKGIFFTITDSNTKGLLGDVLDPENYDALSESDHWARFEGFGFTVINPDAIGARGQGKFIFLNASKDYLMFYDSLRIDGTYRIGTTKAMKTKCPMLHWDEDKGRKILKKYTDIQPLSKTGTRIIIVNPIEDLINEIYNGDFKNAIEETWFRAIEKQRVKIYIKYNNKIEIAEVPELFSIPKKDTNKIKVWIKGIKEKEEIKLSDGRKFRIKHLQIAYIKKANVPEQLRGVSIIHNNMKITSINMEGVPFDISNNILGFVEFDRELDRELRKNYNQAPTHYDLKWRRTIPKMIKNYVHDELRKFGYEKLKIGIDPRERRKQIRETAEIEALRDLSKYAKDLDLFGRIGGSVKPRKKQLKTPQNKNIGLILNNFNFPEPERAPRVNWGEEIKDFEVIIFNKTSNNIKGRLRIFILFGDKEINTIHDEKCIDITQHFKSIPFGPFNIIFSKNIFPDPGIYRLRIRLINEVSNIEIDNITRKIWIEKDPEFRLPFETIKDDFTDKEPIKNRQWITEGILGENPVLYYNTEHPAYKNAEDDEDLNNYLFEIFLEGSIDFILNRPDKEDGSPDYHPLDSKKILDDPKEAYLEISGKIAEIKSKHYGEI